MSYLEQTRKPSPTSLMAVIGIHAGIGSLLVAGLTVSGVIATPERPVPTFDIPDVPPPPPPPPPTDPTPRTSQPDVSASNPITVPAPDVRINPSPPRFNTTDLILPPVPTPRPGPITLDPPAPKPLPSPQEPAFDPVSAKPRNDPGGWLRNNDYKSSWARRELTGTARFRLDISKTGTITGCRVTGTTGHGELDAATCVLLEKRARFEPARGRQGEPVAGTYSGAVRWELPD